MLFGNMVSDKTKILGQGVFRVVEGTIRAGQCF